jgi:Ran GTPase-activating protein (RanGAP) involved in mRNA processing and transport
MVFEAMNPNYKENLPREWWLTGYQIMPADEVIEQIKNNDPKYTVMDMSERQLHGSRCEILAEAMMGNTHIYEVDFRGNGFDADGLFALVQAFKSMPALKVINLRGNTCRNEGVEALAKWLKTNKTVTHLNLNENNLGDQGAKWIAGALKENSTIQVIDLSLNYITNEGAKEIAAALDVNKSITMLNISANDIEDKALRKKCRARNSAFKWVCPSEDPNAPWRATTYEELKPVDFDKVKPPEPRIESKKK